jgi:hypothetical protein
MGHRFGCTAGFRGIPMVYACGKMLGTIAFGTIAFGTIACGGFRADCFRESLCQQRYFASIRMSRNRIG